MTPMFILFNRSQILSNLILFYPSFRAFRACFCCNSKDITPLFFSWTNSDLQNAIITFNKIPLFLLELQSFSFVFLGKRSCVPSFLCSCWSESVLTVWEKSSMSTHRVRFQGGLHTLVMVSSGCSGWPASSSSTLRSSLRLSRVWRIVIVSFRLFVKRHVWCWDCCCESNSTVCY